MARAGAKTGAKTAVGVRAQKPEVSKTHEEESAGSDAAAEVKPSEGDVDPSLLVNSSNKRKSRRPPHFSQGIFSLSWEIFPSLFHTGDHNGVHNLTTTV